MSATRRHRRPVLRPRRARPRPGRSGSWPRRWRAPTTASCSWNTASRRALAFDDGKLKSASFDTTQGFGLRAVAGEAHRLCPCQRAVGSRAASAPPPRSRRCMPAMAAPWRSRRRHQPRSSTPTINPLAEVDFERQGRSCCRRSTPMPAPSDPRVAPGDGLDRRRLAGGADHPRRRPPRRRHPPAGAAQRLRRGRARTAGMETGSHGAGGRFAYEPIVDPAALAGAGRRGAAPGAGQPRLASRRRPAR